MLTRGSRLRLSIVIALACCFVLHAQQRRPQTISGRVVAIADGDTLTVLDPTNTQHRVRLTGIDAPESRQDFGTRARQNLADLVFGKQVIVEYDKEDRYGRTLGKVLIGGRDVNLEQIKAGLAWHYKYYENEQPPGDRKTYAEAEREAREARRGLLADQGPVPPWDFRRGGGRRGGETPAGNVTGGPAVGTRGGAAVIGNRRSMIYHRPDCPNYGEVSPQNRVPFRTSEGVENTGVKKDETPGKRYVAFKDPDRIAWEFYMI